MAAVQGHPSVWQALPCELIDRVLSYLDGVSIARVAQTCRWSMQCCQERLYKHIRVGKADGCSRPGSVKVKSVEAFARTLLERPDLAALVKTACLGNVSHGFESIRCQRAIADVLQSLSRGPAGSKELVVDASGDLRAAIDFAGCSNLNPKINVVNFSDAGYFERDRSWQAALDSLQTLFRLKSLKSVSFACKLNWTEQDVIASQNHDWPTDSFFDASSFRLFEENCSSVENITLGGDVPARVILDAILSWTSGLRYMYVGDGLNCNCFTQPSDVAAIVESLARHQAATLETFCVHLASETYSAGALSLKSLSALQFISIDIGLVMPSLHSDSLVNGNSSAPRAEWPSITDLLPSSLEHVVFYLEQGFYWVDTVAGDHDGKECCFMHRRATEILNWLSGLVPSQEKNFPRLHSALLVRRACRCNQSKIKGAEHLPPVKLQDTFCQHGIQLAYILVTQEKTIADNFA